MDPKWTRVIAIVVIVAVVIAGVAFYYVRNRSSSSCSLTSKNPLIVDQAETPDNPDPAATFTTPGWALVQQVYQGMVNYNGSSTTTFVPVLAHDWTTSNGNLTWTFHLRSGVTFSNGDPYNAYVQWFTMYRTLVMNQPPTFILGENFALPPNLNASQMANDLNNFNFENPTSNQLAVMMAPNQSFQVVNNLTIQLNLGMGYLGNLPYTYLLATLSAPTAFAVDPVAIQQNKGVTPNSTNDWMALNMLGTGQYTLQGTFSTTGSGYELQPNANYWGKVAAAQEPWNNMIQPAHVAIQVEFQGNSQVAIQDLKSGAAATASFAYLGPAEVAQLQGLSCVNVQPLDVVYGSTSGAWWIYMNQNTFPFNNISVREAVVHAIDYPEIIGTAFGGAATQWVGPVPPGYPYYNPANLPAYAYNVTQAQQEIASSPCKANACVGTVLNYMYLNVGDEWFNAAKILQANLATIGITINPVGVSLPQLYAEQPVDPMTSVCTAQEKSAGLGPFPIGQEFYTSDYIAPDDWTQNNAATNGSANYCMSAYADGTVNNLVYAAAGESNPANLTSDYTTITQRMYANYTDAWLVVPTQFSIYNPLLHGFVENPMASAEPFSILFNTQSAS
jgi:peptide/nickel transport system substrate-binding protein